MNTRLIAVTATLSLLAACSSSPAPGTNGTATPPPSESTSSAVIAPIIAKEGEQCGGIAGIQCEPRLFCKYDGAYPDAAGTCVK